MSGERSAVDEASTDQWIKDVLKPTLARYSKKDVFNCDESGLFWRLLPDRTLAFKSDKCSGGKKSKERVTFLLCTNVDGSQKMPVFALGRFAQPRSFRGVKTIPVEYSANASSWMTSELFKTWLTQFDRRMKAEKRSVADTG